MLGENCLENCIKYIHHGILNISGFQERKLDNIKELLCDTNTIMN